MPLKFTTGGKTYTASALTRPTIRDFMDLAVVTKAAGRCLSSADVFRIEGEVEACQSAAERTTHPDFMTFLALIVWATLAEQGVPDPYNRAIDTRLDDLDFFYDEPEPEVPSKARTRAASARAAKRPAVSRSAAKKTSNRRSSAVS